MPKSGMSLRDWCIKNSYMDILDAVVNTSDSLYSFGSHIKIEWVCLKGHRFIRAISNMTSVTSSLGVHFTCPVCSGKTVLVGYNDLQTTRPDLASEWNYERNGDITPEQVTRGSFRTV